MDRFVHFRQHLYHQANQHFPFAASKSTMISPQETCHLTIRDPASADEADWRLLWSGYCIFYETKVPEAITAATWKRMLAPASPLFGRIAEWDGQVVGFAVSVLHEGSWTIRPCCYLEDLFVAPDLRGRGIARALIEDQLRLCRERGWSRLYWHTRGSNREARRLYDRFTTADDFVRYRMIFE
jgi:GNAT superfamily N-acetyltransferase